MKLNKKVVAIIAFLIVVKVNKAQVGFRQTNTGGQLELRDLNGNSFLPKVKDYADVEGSCFLTQSFNKAVFMLNDGTIVKNVQTNFNLLTNEILFINDANDTLACKDGLVKKFSFENLRDNKGTEIIYKSGYPSIDKQTNNYFYQLLAEGKIDVLKKNYRYISTTKNDLTKETRKQFEERSSYYIATSSSIQELKFDKIFLPNLLSDKQKLVDNFILNNDLNLKKIGDIIKLLTYYKKL